MIAEPCLTTEDLAARFGPMAAWRIRSDSPPGTATEGDVLRRYEKEGRFCELVDGILLEKDVALDSSALQR